MVGLGGAAFPDARQAESAGGQDDRYGGRQRLRVRTVSHHRPSRDAGAAGRSAARRAHRDEGARRVASDRRRRRQQAGRGRGVCGRRPRAFADIDGRAGPDEISAGRRKNADQGAAAAARSLPAACPPMSALAVFNVATLAQIGELLPRRQGLIERVVTITGPGVAKPGNYLVALGTPLRWALEQAGCADRRCFGDPRRPDDGTPPSDRSTFRSPKASPASWSSLRSEVERARAKSIRASIAPPAWMSVPCI